MSFKERRARRTEAKDAAENPSAFRHASGYADLEGVLGEHTLDEAQQANAISPKGYRARSVAKQASNL